MSGLLSVSLWKRTPAGWNSGTKFFCVVALTAEASMGDAKEGEMELRNIRLSFNDLAGVTTGLSSV